MKGDFITQEEYTRPTDKEIQSAIQNLKNGVIYFDKYEIDRHSTNQIMAEAANVFDRVLNYYA